ncbi:MAG: glucose 1-dehydrogenase [Deltaproteobacteria bacterium]|nr:glucose 1-dehydrogenase [Deltaproteobacteria bacterium]
MGSLEGKVALVTGGSSGIGRATGIMLAREGAKVVIASDKNIKGGKETVRMIQQAGGDAIFVRTDVSRADEVEAMVKKASDTYGRLDCAVNNAGVPGMKNDEEELERVININLKGVWFCLKYEISWMINHGGGAIVNVSSIGGLKGGRPGMELYCASKHGVIGLTRTHATTHARNGIRINAVCPGTIATPMTAPQKDNPDFTWAEFAKATVPMGRQGTAEEVAEAVVWLCSDAASYITGIALPVDGGILAE